MKGPQRSTGSAAERYDTCLRRIRHHDRLPAGFALPQPTSAWPPENTALLERYRTWLLSGGTSPHVVHSLYVPLAGHVLGLALRPHPTLDLQADIDRALEYVRAKRESAEWTDMCRTALEKFRRFLRQLRGEPEVSLPPLDLSDYQAGLPAWLVEHLERYTRLKSRQWRPAAVRQQTRRFWGAHVRVWRWLFDHCAVTAVADIRRQHLLDYLDDRLKTPCSVRTVNAEIRQFHGFLAYLQEQDVEVPQALLRMQGLKEPEELPRFLTDEQVRRLRDDFEARVVQAVSPVQQRDALLDRAAFYLLWQGGMRRGEVEDLTVEALDLEHRRLTVRQGKNRRDRTVLLSDRAVRALGEYLAVRGLGSSSHVFLFRNRRVCKDLIRDRIQAAGERVGFRVYPHRLRHTFGTQLLNAGCPVTSVQKLLGHRHLSSTLRYAKVHDQTVETDYFAAMAAVERRLDLGATGENAPPLADDERGQLLDLAERLRAPKLETDLRLALVEQLLRVLMTPRATTTESSDHLCDFQPAARASPH